MGERLASSALRRVLEIEAEAVLAIARRLDDSFEDAVSRIYECRGRVITCGIGKSGHIARKAAGTLSSTGTPSLFLHAAEAAHGDLGMIAAGDVVLLYTYSGETDEVVRLFPSLDAQGAWSILLTGRRESSAGRLARLVLDCSVEREACPNNLAPTASTTAMLAVSDALAVAVMERRGFGWEDFARYHPSGALGRRLLLTVRDVMRTGEDLPVVGPSEPFIGVLSAITRAGAGAACVVDSSGALIGLISDGDLRRHILACSRPMESVASDFMTRGVATVGAELLAVEALEAFQNHPRKIGEMPVVGAGGRVEGLLVLKDLLRVGIV